MNTSNASSSAFVSMTIGAALREIKSVKGEVSEHGQRAARSIMFSVTEGVEPPVQVFDFATERKARERAQEWLVRLQSAVAVTNARTSITFEGRKMPLAEAIRRFEELKGDLAWLEALQINERVETRREVEYADGVLTGHRTVKTTHSSHLSERDRVKEVAVLRERAKSLNLLIEATNHRVLVRVEPLPKEAPDA
jgi:hypothetical protein